MLLIWDGWGLSEDPAVSAIEAAHTPFYDSVRQRYPFVALEASGEAVGLPPGQMGNSEVGHLHIGAGFVVWQDLPRIDRALTPSFAEENAVFRALLSYVRAQKRPLHLLGLVSDGGVHSGLSHLLKLLMLLRATELPVPIYLHAFTDGRDTDPRSAPKYFAALEPLLADFPQARVASLIGRYYAMDRDRRWERTRLAYRLLVHAEGETFSTPQAALEHSYAQGITDEFVRPSMIGEPVRIQPGDAVLFFNFRNDRPRQLVQALYTGPLPEGQSGRAPVPMPEDLQPLSLYFVTLTEYDPAFTQRGVHYLFGKTQIELPLGAVVARAGLSQVRIAETEKYPHVTYFLNGGREEPFPGEQRILVPSPKVPTYDLKPEMSAYEVRDALMPVLKQGEAAFVCINFANPDMVGHTGVWEAAVKACETVDSCSAQLVEVALRKGYTVLLIADHGNADRMRNPDGSPHTAHTTAPVPCILISSEPLPYRLVSGILPQVAPTVLTLMGLEPPPQMLPPLLEPLEERLRLRP